MWFSTPGAQLPSEPSVAVTRGGRAVIAWWRRDSSLAPTGDVVQLRNRPTPAAPFIGPVTISAKVSNPFAQPVTATAPGIALVGWTEQTLAGAGLAVGLCAILKKAGITQTAVLPEGTAAALRGLDVAVAPTGAAVAVWTRDPFPVAIEGGDQRVRVAMRRARRGDWSAPADLSGPARPARPWPWPPTGRRSSSGSAGGHRVGRDRAGRGLGAPAAVPGAGAGARRPAVALNGAGDAVADLVRGRGPRGGPPHGGAFGPPQALSAAGGLPKLQNLKAPALALAGGGRAVAAWRRATAGHFRVEASVGSVAGPWRPPAVLSPASNRNAGQPTLRLNGAGAAVVGWSQPLGTSLSAIRARILATPGAAPFGPVEAISTAAGRGTAPSVGVDSAGGPGRLARGPGGRLGALLPRRDPERDRLVP